MHEKRLAYQFAIIAERQGWLPGVDLHEVVDTIRADDSHASDDALRLLLHADHPEAPTVALYALAPRVRKKLGDNSRRSHEYVYDVYGNLAVILAEGPHDGTCLARRLVGRAHQRTYAAVRRVHRKSVHGQPVIVLPMEPDSLVHFRDENTVEPSECPFSGSPLTERDVALIRATRIHGLPLRDTALLLGMSYQQASKRRQRAEAEWASWRGIPLDWHRRGTRR
jgi:hypothetical protein